MRVSVIDPHNVPIQYFDWIVSGGSGAGIVNVALAAIDHGIATNEAPRVILQAKLRMNVTVAANLHRFLGELLAGHSPKPTSHLN